MVCNRIKETHLAILVRAVSSGEHSSGHKYLWQGVRKLLYAFLFLYTLSTLAIGSEEGFAIPLSLILKWVCHSMELRLWSLTLFVTLLICFFETRFSRQPWPAHYSDLPASATQPLGSKGVHYNKPGQLMSATPTHTGFLCSSQIGMEHMFHKFKYGQL